AGAAGGRLGGARHRGRLRAAGGPRCEPIEPDGAVECAERDGERGLELVQVPAEPLLAAPALGDQVVAVIEQELQLPQLLLAGTRPVEVRFAQGGTSDRERVEPIRLAADTAASTLRRRQPWRHPHEALAGLE